MRLTIENPMVWILVIAVLVRLNRVRNYKNGTYYKDTKVSYFASRRDKGRCGEYLLYENLRRYERCGGKFLFNTYVPKKNGQTSEIDVMLILPQGIFVFESKNYSGWIFGNETQRNWYQTLPKGRGRSQKEVFYNPVLQNFGHIKSIREFLDDTDIPMYSIVTFSERCTLKRVLVDNDNVWVIKRSDAKNVVRKICDSYSGSLLSTEKVEEIYRRLYPYTQVEQEIKERHIADITPASVQHNEKASDKKEMAGLKDTEESLNRTVTKRCPQCGGQLILRTAKRGENAGKQFWGCSNYPKCRYIRNI